MKQRKLTLSTRRRSLKNKMKYVSSCNSIESIVLDHNYCAQSPPTFINTPQVEIVSALVPSVSSVELNNSTSTVECENFPWDHNYCTQLLPRDINDSSADDNLFVKPKLNMSGFALDGRRIVDIDYFFQQLIGGGTHKPFDCSILDMEITSERRSGLCSTFELKCKMCGFLKKVCTDSKEGSTMNVNDSVILGSTSIGIGYTQCDEFFASVNVPFMAANTYSAVHARVADVIQTSALASMEEAAREETEIAKNVGDVDKEGIPCITVVADGAWSKRSYNVNYNALSGVACIIGQRTGKLLYLGVRNKYCCICAKAEKNNKSSPTHHCYKNFNGSSTAMESDIIVDGFRNSMQMYGIKYTRLVGDGDSSVQKKLLLAQPYPHTVIEKIECRNHLYRNFSSKLREICNRKRSNSKNAPVPVYLRKHVERSSQRLCVAIKKAQQFRRTQNLELSEKIELLKQDILNSPSHVFGEHKQCQAINYFNCTPKESEINLVPEMRACGLYDDILLCLHRLIYNASSLLHNMNNNDAEHYNSVVCKFVGGKRINFSLKGAYETRCKAAALSFNTKRKYYTILHRALTNNCNPPHILQQYISKCARLSEARRRKATSYRKIKVLQTADKDYGAVNSFIELDDVTYKTKAAVFLSELEKTPSEIQNIEKETRGQSSNPKWFQYRNSRLSASNFGIICKMKKTTSRAKKVENMLYGKFAGNTATRYGNDNEPFAIQEFEKQFNTKVESCGFFIDAECGYFGASPDGLIGEDGIIEVKCPFNCKNISPQASIMNKTIKFATINKDGNMELKKNHNYYYQVQGELHITGRMYCYFIVWSRKGMLVEKIYKDTDFWEKKMLLPLRNFYMECMLPEIVDPKYPHNVPIKSPAR